MQTIRRRTGDIAAATGAGAGILREAVAGSVDPGGFAIATLTVRAAITL